MSRMQSLRSQTPSASVSSRSRLICGGRRTPTSTPAKRCKAFQAGKVTWSCLLLRLKVSCTCDGASDQCGRAFTSKDCSSLSLPKGQTFNKRFTGYQQMKSGFTTESDRDVAPVCDLSVSTSSVDSSRRLSGSTSLYLWFIKHICFPTRISSPTQTKDKAKTLNHRKHICRWCTFWFSSIM